MVTPDPITTVQQAIAEANRLLATCKPGCAVVITPHVLSLIVEAAQKETPA